MIFFFLNFLFAEKVSKPAMQQIVNQYFPYDLKANESELALQFVKMATDGMYGWCMETTASALSDAGLPVHVYQYDYRGSNSMLELLLRLQQESGSPVQHNLHNPSSSDIPRPSPSAAAPMSPPVLPHNMQRLVCHGDELFSLFQLKISGLRASSEMDNLVSVQLTSMWAEFASLHNQSWLFKTDRGLWPTFRSKRQVLLVQQTPKVITLPVQPAFLFWQQLHSAIQSNSTAATVHNSGYLPVINPDALYEPATDPPGSSNTTKYATLAFTMIGVSIGLLLLVVLLLAILWYTKRSQSFSAIVADGTNSPSLY